MTEQEIKQLFIETNAIMEGHFLLTSGLHSPLYVEKFNVLQHPDYTESFAGSWRRDLRTTALRQLSGL